MLKWLKDRQLGNTVDRRTIYEHISISPNFPFKGMINYNSQYSNDGTGLDIMDFAWANDGYNLVAIVSDYVRYDYHYDIQRQMITVLDPNNDNGQLIKVDIFLSGGQFCIFFSKLVRDIDLILLASCSSQNLYWAVLFAISGHDQLRHNDVIKFSPCIFVIF